MIWLDAAIALVAALLFGLIFLHVLRRTSPWLSRRLLFLVLFLAVWAGGSWMTPVGPTLWGIYWLPYVVVALVLILLLAAAAPPSRPLTKRASIEQMKEAVATQQTVSVFLWLLLLVLLVIIGAQYLLAAPKSEWTPVVG